MNIMNMLLIASLLTISAAHLYQREIYEHMLLDHMNKFNVKFSDAVELSMRIDIFADNHDSILLHNKGNHTYKKALNKFAHLTANEFRDYVNTGGSYQFKKQSEFTQKARSPQRQSHKYEGVDLKRSIDWVANGAVTPVQDQGGCGCCWAFSTTGSLEGAYKIKNGILVAFSTEQLAACDTIDAGCNGGWMDDAFTWIRQNGGLTTAGQYPYTSGDGDIGSCQTSGITNVPDSAPTSYTDVQPNVAAVQSAVSQQPVSIAIESDEDVFQFYSSGVITSGCGNDLDHGVLIVGYGVESGVPYWKIKNSWGTSWGINGYVLIERSNADQCGVLDAASYPNL